MSSIPDVVKIDIGSHEKVARALITFLNSKSICYPVVQVFDKKAIKPRSIVPTENTTTFGTNNIPSEEELSRLLEENDYALNAFATLPNHPNTVLCVAAAETFKRIPPSSPSKGEDDFVASLGDGLIVTIMGDKNGIDDCIENIGDLKRTIEWETKKSENSGSIDLFLRNEIHINGNRYDRNSFAKIAKDIGCIITDHPFERGIKCIDYSGKIRINNIDCNFLIVEAIDGEIIDMVFRPSDIHIWVEECSRTAQADPYDAPDGTRLCDYIFDSKHRVTISGELMTFNWYVPDQPNK